MTKTLTEQWRNGTLEESMYYVKLPDNDIPIVNLYQLKQLALVNDDDEIEVLAAVPDYDQVSQLVKKVEQFEKKLDIAVKALEWYADYTNSMKGVFNMKPEKEAQEALKQIKELDK